MSTPLSLPPFRGNVSSTPVKLLPTAAIAIYTNLIIYSLQSTVWVIGKNVHGTIVAAETKLKNNVRKGAYLVFMESEKSLRKEIKETQEKKKKDMEGKV